MKKVKLFNTTTGGASFFTPKFAKIVQTMQKGVFVDEIEAAKLELEAKMKGGNVIEVKNDNEVYSAEGLSDKTLPELKEIARAKSIEIKARTPRHIIIQMILDNQ